jgi:hypothetical protein
VNTRLLPSLEFWAGKRSANESASFTEVACDVTSLRNLSELTSALTGDGLRTDLNVVEFYNITMSTFSHIEYEVASVVPAPRLTWTWNILAPSRYSLC